MKTIFQRTIWIAICASFCASTFGQQYRLSGRLTDEKGARLENVTVMITAADTLVAGAVTDAKGEFSISGIAAGTFFCKASLLGYKALEQSISVKGNTKLQLSMQEDSKVLSEVTVNAHREDIVTSNASSTTFLLSENARKKSRDAFEALREIPKLSVDVINKKISLIDGSSPLILINGVKRPSYINAINPEEIEAVEVVENPSSRYRGEEGTTSMINIRLKRKKDIYVNGNISSRQNPKLIFGVSDANVGLGNDKFSLFASGQQWYFNNEKSDNYSYSHSGNLIRETLGKGNFDSNMIFASIGGDWFASDKNYWAFGINYITNPSHTGYENSGTTVLNGQKSNLSSYRKLNNNYFTNSNYLYFKRTISSTRVLELTATVGTAGSGSNGHAKEQSEFYSFNSDIDMDNNKTNYAFEANYQFTIGKLFSSNLGSNLYHNNLSLDDKMDAFPIYKYKDTREYAYFDFSNLGKHKFTYSVSLGLDLIFTDADKTKNHYVNFVPSVSLAYKLHPKNVIKFYYSRSRTSPDASQLNPRNTSTDSLQVYTGNPYLKPQLTDQFKLSYEWSFKALYFNPYITYRNVTKSIEGTSKTVDNIYYSSYYNMNSYQSLQAGFSSRLRLSRFGNISMSIFYNRHYFGDDYPYKAGALGFQGNMYLFYKNVSLNMNLYHNGIFYKKLSKTKVLPNSETTFSWNMPKGWNVNIGIRYFLPQFEDRSWGFSDNYESFSYKKYTNRKLMPMIGFSYNFKNKVKINYRNTKRFYSPGEGVNIEVK